MSEKGGCRGGGCFKVVGIGCAVMLAVLAILALVAYLNIDAIKEMDWYRSISEAAEGAKTEMQYMLELRSELAGAYPAQDIQMQVNMDMGNRGSGRILVVEFINPAFSLPESSEGKEESARAIARRVAVIYPEI